MLPHNTGWKKSWAIGISHSTCTKLNLIGCIPSLESACCLWGRPNIPALVFRHTQQHSRNINQMHPWQKNRDWHPSKMNQQSRKGGRPFRPQLAAWLPKRKTLDGTKPPQAYTGFPARYSEEDALYAGRDSQEPSCNPDTFWTPKASRRLWQNLFYALLLPFFSLLEVENQAKSWSKNKVLLED